MTDFARWQDKVALVTGASSGIGEAIAHSLLAQGLRVVLWGRRMQRLQALSAAYAQDRTLWRVVDLRDEAQIHAGFAELKATWGGVDVLINNAGLGHQAPLLEPNSAAWQEMFQVNVLALCSCTQLAVQSMLERGGEGHVLHLSSLAAHRIVPGGGAYAATKAAVRSLTESLRTELHAKAAPIRVSSVSPGYVETEFHAGFFADAHAAQALYSRYQVLQPADIAGAVLYALGTPAHVQVHDVLLRSVAQPT